MPVLLLLGVLVAVSPAGATAFNAALTRAPYLTDLIGNHVIVNWATNQSATAGTLQWGPVSSGTCTLSNSLTPTRSSITVGTVAEYQWKASLSLPGAGTYCYRPRLATTDLLAGNSSPQFQTQAPAGNSTPYSFDVFGDWGQVDSTGASPDQANLFQQVAASGARFAVSVGDNGYPNGSQVNYGDLQQTGPDTSAVFGPSFWTVAGSTIPLFPAAGNHGLSGTTHTDITTWTEDSAISSSGGRYQNDVYCCVNGSSSANYASEWYAFDAGPARFYLLDSAWGDSNVGTGSVYANDAAAHFTPGTPEYTWLVNDLQNHPSTLKFAFFHYPLYSDNPNQSSDTYLQGSNGLEGLLGRYGVNIVFNGHAHIYQRNRASAAGMPVSYVTGGGGSTLEPIGPCQSVDAYGIGWSPTKLTGSKCGAAVAPTTAAQVFHFLKVTVAGSTVTVAPTDETGHTFDVQTYTFASAPDTVIDSAPPALTTSSTATLTFHSTRSGATFACSLDGAPATACTSPVNYSSLSSGAHTFSVAATTSAGTDPTPASASWTVDASPPSTPTSLAATAQSATVVSLSWTAATDNNAVTGYDVQRNGSTIGSTGSPTASYLDTTAAPSTSYSYRVIARDAAGNASPPSSPATVTTPASTGLPTLVQTAGSSTTTVTLPGTSAAGDLLVLSAGVYTGASKPITAVSDGRNTWTKAGAYFVTGQNSDGELWYAANAASVRTITVTTTAPVALRVQEFTNMASSAVLDGAAGTAATSSTASSPTVTPTVGNDLAIGFTAGHANAEAITVTSSGYSVAAQQTTTSPSIVTLVSGSRVLPGTGAQSFSASFPNAMYWSAGLALFKAAAPPPPPNDFSISASPASVSVTAGQNGTSTINSTVTSGNPQTVALTGTGAPSGVSVGFNPASITSGQSSTLTLSTTAATAPGSYPITITGTGASATHGISLTLTITAQPNDFALAANPSTLSVTAGQNGTSTISTAVTSGNPQTVALSATGAPVGVSVGFNPTSITAGQSSTATITTTSSAAPGSYPITITGTGASATHGISLTLTITAAPNDFSISASPASVSVTAGQNGTSTISTAVTSGNPQTVALTATGAPVGVSVGFNPTSITAGQSSTATITTTSSAAPGSYPITITGTGTSATHGISLTLTITAAPNDFSISASPASISVTAGQNGTSTISSTVTSGNPQPVALTSSGAPSGVTASFDNATITSGQSATLTLSTTSSAMPGSYPITITGTGSAATHTTTVTLTVTAAPNDFSISASPASVSVTAGQNGTSTISSTVTSGNPQTVALTGTGAPSGVSVGFNPASITAGQSSTATITTTSSAAPGSYPLTITGTGASATHGISLTLTITAAPNDFSISASPASVSVTAGQNGSSTISSAVTSGNPQTVALTSSGAPSGVSVGFNPASITSGQSATLTLSTTSSATPGSYPITITGTGASATHGISLTLTITAPPLDDFSIAENPSTLSVIAGQNGTSTISSTVTSGNPQPVALTSSGAPSGVTASFDNATITSGQSATLTLSTTSSAVPGSYPITITGTGSAATHTTTVTLTVTAPPPPDDFSIAANPTTLSVTAGQGGSSLISSTVTSGNPQPITLAASGLPTGATASFDTTSITAGQSATLTLTTTSASTPAGSYPITITGSGASATHTATVTLTVTAPPPPDDFSLAANPSTLSVTAGQNGTSTINSTVTSGNPQPVALTSSGAPSGVSIGFNPASITAGQSSTATITTTSSAAPGSYPITITGTGSAATHTTTVTLTVTAPPPPDDFSIAANPSAVSVIAGQNGTSTISSTVTSGNPQPVALTSSGAPSGVTASFDNATITSGQSATLTLSTTSSAVPGSYPVTITGTGSAATHGISLTLTITAPVPDDFSIAANPSTLSVTAGQTGNSTISSTVTSGNPQPVALTATGAPSGVTVGFNPTSITAGQSSTATITTTSSATPGSYPITITGTGSAATHGISLTLTITAAVTGPRLVQAGGATETSTATTLTATLPTASTAGDLLVLSASVYTGLTNHLTSITDSAGNVWQRANAWSVASHNSDGELWYAANAAPATTITAHVATAATIAFSVQEFSGIAASNPLDTSVGTSNTGTSANSGPLTPGASGELLVGLTAGHANSQTMTPSTAGFTLQPQRNSSGSIVTVLTGYQVVAGTGATSFGATFGTAMYWAAGIVAFKAG